METITIELIGGTVITLIVLSWGFYKGFLYAKDNLGNNHLYDLSEIKSINKG